ncbi:MAG: hypothetical protein A3F40_01285 [Chlamydiae bacterium RIFCSPHIGHO2_12_FULL_27_8]|nr:MAG: hypothetical protein A3F40_01285 [Chlamydiae bacterium RIFCSPHIGHO2_12_FULL_27_8]
MFEKKTFKINALNFFDLSLDIYKFESIAKLVSKKYLLPSFSNLLEEEEFAKVYIAYASDGIYLHFEINAPFTKGSMQETSKGDLIEIFIDSRALKTKGYLTKYSHHFVFVADEEFGNEVTRFKFDDMHDICDRKFLKADSIIKPEKYMMTIKIDKDAIYGFNPKETKFLSFCYQINRYLLPNQTLNISSQEHKIEKSPHLWAKLNFK